MTTVTTGQNKQADSKTGPVIASATLIGIGMGGFVDGILFHQILQWHQMLSARLPPDTLTNKSINMFWDGIFHSFVWLTTIVGIMMLWRLIKRRDIVASTSLFTGGLLLGWALFNIIESVVDHYVFVLHNVKENSPNPQWWNHGFMAFSLILLIIGWRLVRR